MMSKVGWFYGNVHTTRLTLYKVPAFGTHHLRWRNTGTETSRSPPNRPCSPDKSERTRSGSPSCPSPARASRSSRPTACSSNYRLGHRPHRSTCCRRSSSRSRPCKSAPGFGPSPWCSVSGWLRIQPCSTTRIGRRRRRCCSTWRPCPRWRRPGGWRPAKRHHRRSGSRLFCRRRGTQRRVSLRRVKSKKL